jgi:cytochrome P450
VILLSEKYFRNAYKYAPERWLPLDQRPSEYMEGHLDASQPFSVGPTGCIGKPLALAEMRVLIVKVICRYILSTTKDKPFTWEALRKMMIVEKNPLWLILERREAT